MQAKRRQSNIRGLRSMPQPSCLPNEIRHTDRKRRGDMPNREKMWSDQEFSSLMALYPTAHKTELLSAIPNRSEEAIYKMARRMGLFRPSSKGNVTGTVTVSSLSDDELERELALLRRVVIRSVPGKPRWTPVELEYLRRNCDRLTTRQLAGGLGTFRSLCAVGRRVERLRKEANQSER